jgi:Mg2+ and Co2+ transporter CorA
MTGDELVAIAAESRAQVRRYLRRTEQQLALERIDAFTPAQLARIERVERTLEAVRHTLADGDET